MDMIRTPPLGYRFEITAERWIAIYGSEPHLCLLALIVSRHLRRSGSLLLEATLRVMLHLEDHQRLVLQILQQHAMRV